jgi:hypothetical protein
MQMRGELVISVAKALPSLLHSRLTMQMRGELVISVAKALSSLLHSQTLLLHRKDSNDDCKGSPFSFENRVYSTSRISSFSLESFIKLF